MFSRRMKMRAKPLGLLKWAKYALQDCLFLDPSRISEAMISWMLWMSSRIFWMLGPFGISEAGVILTDLKRDKASVGDKLCYPSPSWKSYGVQVCFYWIPFYRLSSWPASNHHLRKLRDHRSCDSIPEELPIPISEGKLCYLQPWNTSDQNIMSKDLYTGQSFLA